MKVLHPHGKKPMPWMMGKDWQEFYRVRLPSTALESEKTLWCRNNIPANNWVKNFGGEVFYFLNIEDAAAFKLRWEGATS